MSAYPGTELCRTDPRGTFEIIRSYLAKDRTIPTGTLAKKIVEDYKPRWRSGSSIKSAIQVIRGLKADRRGKLSTDTTFFLNEAEEVELKRRAATAQSSGSLGRLSLLGIEIERIIKRYPKLSDTHVMGVILREQCGLLTNSLVKRAANIRKSLKARNEYPYDKK